MKRLISVRWWASKWVTVLLFVGLTAVFVFSLHQTNQLQESEARTERDIARRSCEQANERTLALRDLLLGLVADPNPHQFDFVNDPQLRAGVIEETRRSRADTRARITTSFVARDCAAEIPPPPGG